MDSVISLGKEVRERDKSVMIPGFEAWANWAAGGVVHPSRKYRGRGARFGRVGEGG